MRRLAKYTATLDAIEKLLGVPAAGEQPRFVLHCPAGQLIGRAVWHQDSPFVISDPDLYPWPFPGPRPSKPRDLAGWQARHGRGAEAVEQELPAPEALTRWAHEHGVTIIRAAGRLEFTQTPPAWVLAILRAAKLERRT